MNRLQPVSDPVSASDAESGTSSRRGRCWSVTAILEMCGIAATFAHGPDAGPIREAELLLIRERQHSRGPDDEGLWLSPDRKAGLGHRRLSIVDLTREGRQPMLSADGKAVIAFNGEIYNYQDLRRELEADGCVFRSRSDTEVILELYRRMGRKMLNRLRGMFAVAIWDDERGGLLLARDTFGIKPLYYADDGSVVRVASSVRALTAGGNVSLDLDPAAQVGFFLWGHVPEPFTIYRDVKPLPAGSWIWFGCEGARQAGEFEQVKDCLSEIEHTEGVADKLRAACEESVRRHLMGDVPVGLFLSAGIDSGVLAGSLRDVGQTPKTVTLGFQEYRGTPLDEVPLAEEVATLYDTDHQTVWVTKEDFAAANAAFFDAMDQPTVDGVNTYFVSMAARRAGLKVAMSGLGGDELFGGYPSYQQVPRLARSLSMFKRLGALGRITRAVAAPLVRNLTSPKYAGLLEYGGTYEGAFLLRRGLFMPWELPGLLGSETARLGWERLQLLKGLRETHEVVDSDHRKVMLMETNWYMRNQLLRDSDWASMAHSLEVRVPWVDTHLWKSTSALRNPTGPPSKPDFARTPRRPLPAEVLARAKSGFFVPVRDWLREDSGRDRDDRGLRGWAKYVFSRYVRN